MQRWVVRIVSFYFGYKILHHEIYDVSSPEPLTLFLGLWLCGIAPADVFDGLRRMGDDVKSKVQDATNEQLPPGHDDDVLNELTEEQHGERRQGPERRGRK